MKKVLFFVSVLTMLLVTVSCKNPNTSSPKEEEQVTTKKAVTKQSEEPEQPIVNPPVDLSVDYYYIGDMLFADSMDFDKWCFTAGTWPSFNGTIIKVEKISRVRNRNKSTQMFRYSETLPDVERYETNPNWFYVEYATKYKVWVSKDFMNPDNKQYWKSETELVNTSSVSGEALGNISNVDGTWIKLTYSEVDNTYTFDYRESAKAQYYN